MALAWCISSTSNETVESTKHTPMHRPTPPRLFCLPTDVLRVVALPTRTKFNKTAYVSSMRRVMVCVSSEQLCRAGRVEGAAGVRGQ